MKLQGKVALITGAKEGIGKAVAIAFAAEGADVALVSRSITRADEVVREVEQRGRRACVVQTDVARQDSVQAMVAQVKAELGPIDILVNNAGLTRPAMLLKMTEEQWDEVINVHLKGTFLCTQAVAKEMAARRSGRILNVTSSAGLQGTIGQVNYTAAKGGISAFTKSAARELAKYGITVNAISPFAETKMTEKIASDPKLRDKYLERVPLGRFGQPEEMAPGFVFLASAEAGYITGQILCIDGGMIMR
ncbi:Short-chain dehydrogenase/reductase, conserved site [Acididesulfobacillus acetoxydans]|uniref:3-oxoacyl-[acyl-carrier-protein] reductase FabG n=1 Tax=Acididesulfobacillus acetoxydans TaxID=1561005 RepID=A0A8S0W7T6_9FIRM|nr:3-oxoacyl-ACP reductase FabG [Acididesulfobacillus acetoxydans]CAA7601109.1 Short-chain dehydrogenase/reductase, conserved site [Acididesulfobacillus acetoxydans]CEJ07144.1 3-oxoacyl-[acyl-carrier-protein] reductase FabG [Acididesulfobacillus acetoxydans]